ncbi:hypothetical protein DKX38_004305 [Salix brachista]|uniref:Uncharacterized protein n=1 Tax=Salix brachista TaxID=2182728 RepID=A0A5N5NCS3_9ROSI|nr:hypothetical protein DKX38_004305 [Salix brachista]
MVLWEITLGTAYFLGLKRTYKLALRIQRRLISRKYPRIRQFAQRMPNGFAQNVDQEHASDASSSILIILSVTQICSLLYISWTTSTGSISFMTSPLARVVSLHVVKSEIVLSGFLSNLNLDILDYTKLSQKMISLQLGLHAIMYKLVHLFLVGATMNVICFISLCCQRTRAIFDVALKVHLNIQQRDIEVGRHLGNRILRWLDRMKPSAQIRGPLPVKPTNGAGSNTNVTKLVTNNTSHLKAPSNGQTSRHQESDRHLFTSARNVWSKPFPSIAMMMRPSRPAGTFTQYRHLSLQGPEMSRPNYNFGGGSGYQGFFRKDIMQYILQN